MLNLKFRTFFEKEKNTHHCPLLGVMKPKDLKVQIFYFIWYVTVLNLQLRFIVISYHYPYMSYDISFIICVAKNPNISPVKIIQFLLKFSLIGKRNAYSAPRSTCNVIAAWEGSVIMGRLKFPMLSHLHDARRKKKRKKER